MTKNTIKEKWKWGYTNYFTSKWMSRYRCVNLNKSQNSSTSKKLLSTTFWQWRLRALTPRTNIEVLPFSLLAGWLLPICNNVWFSMTFTQGAGKYFDYQYSHNIITVFHSLVLNPIHHELVYHQLKISYCWTQALWTAKISPQKKIIWKN